MEKYSTVSVNEFSEVVEKILPKDTEKKYPIIRILNKKGEVENISKIMKGYNNV